MIFDVKSKSWGRCIQNHTNLKFIAPILFILSFFLFGSPPLYGDALFGEIQEMRDYRTAVGLLKEGDYELARDQYQSYLEKYKEPDRVSSAYFGLAETYYLQNMYDTAVTFYLKSLENKNLPENYRNQALKRGLDSINESQRFDLSSDYLANLESLEDEIPGDIRRRAVSILESSGQIQKAFRWAQKYEEQGSDSAYWQYQAGILGAQLDNYDTAIKLLKPLSNFNNNYQDDARFTIAEIQFNRGNFDDAQRYYKLLLEAEDYQHRALYGLGWIDIKKENIFRAKKRLRKVASSANTAQVDAARDLARIYRSEDGVDTAGKWYRKGIQWSDNPTKSELSIEYGNFLVKQGKLKEAVPYFERAKSLKLKAEKSLIRGYLLDGQYKKAVDLIRENRGKDHLTDEVWSIRLATGLFHRGEYQQALEALPTKSDIEKSQNKKLLLSLSGSLHYRLRNWGEAKKIYQTMSSEYSGWESKYYTALLHEKQGESVRAKTKFKKLIDRNPPEPWRSRISYQLSRLNFFDRSFQKYKKFSRGVDKEKLSGPLKYELRLLKFADNVRTDTEKNLIAQAKTLRDTAANYNQLDLWFDYITVRQLQSEWWDELLIPGLKQYGKLKKLRGTDAIVELRESGYYSRAQKLAIRFYEESEPSEWRRNVLNELLITFRESGETSKIGEYLPPKSEWKHWKPINPEDFGLSISEYYHSVNKPEQGLKAIRYVRSAWGETDTKLTFLIDEWEASFLIDLGKHREAKLLLNEIPDTHISNTGRINLSIAEYHTGDTEASFKRLKRIKNSTKKPPNPLYDYGFRYLQTSDESDRMVTWSTDLLEHLNNRDTSARSLLLENVRYWVNNDHSTSALEFIEELKRFSQSTEEMIPLEYYESLAYFNQSQLDKALRQLEGVKNKFSFSKKWQSRILRSEIEVYLRKNNWKMAYKRWNTLNRIGRGGESGRRLLSSFGLNSSVEKFENLLNIMERSYAEFLSPGDTIYWDGRITEKQGKLSKAISRYERYLSNQYSSYRNTAGSRLANLYDRKGQHEKALDVFNKLDNWTGKGIFEIRQAAQLRKLNRYEEARQKLNLAQEEFPSYQEEIHYELGYVNLETDNFSRARESFSIASTDPDTGAGWVIDAKKRYSELSLRANNLTEARKTLNELPAGNFKTLYLAEYHRLSGNPDRGLELIRKVKSKINTSDTSLGEPFTGIASALYWDNQEYKSMVNLFDTLPAQPQRQLWYFKSLIQLERIKLARSIHGQLSSSVKPEATKILADRYYKNKNWELALRYLKQQPGSMERQFKVGNSFRKLGKLRKSYDAWWRGLKQLKSERMSDTRWLDPMVEGLIAITPTTNNLERSTEILDAKWDLTFENKEEIAVKALDWSIQIGDEPLMDRFVNRISQPTTSQFIKIAKKLEGRSDWSRLQEWMDIYRSTRDGVPESFQYGYFKGVLALNGVNNIDTFTVKINQYLNDAVKEKSVFAQKLQRLIADYHYQQKDFNRAAIEYRKVELLFDDGALNFDSKLNLAKSYDQLEQRQKAQKLYHELSGDTVPGPIRKEAMRWLEKSSQEP